MTAVKFEQHVSVGHLVLCNPPDNPLGRAFADDLTGALDQGRQDIERTAPDPHLAVCIQQELLRSVQAIGSERKRLFVHVVRRT